MTNFATQPQVYNSVGQLVHALGETRVLTINVAEFVRTRDAVCLRKNQQYIGE